MNREYIIIHHSLTEDSKTLSWGAIRKNHIEVRGFLDVGYHWGIELVNDDYEILMGRMPDKVGAHAKEMHMNSRSLGIMCCGNFDITVPSSGIIDKLEELVNWLMWEYKIPKEKVIGHRDVGLMAGYDWTKGQYKSCPGKLFSLDEFRDRLIF